MKTIGCSEAHPECDVHHPEGHLVGDGDDLLKDVISEVLRKRGIEESIDELSKRVLRDSKALESADALVKAAHDYIVRFVKAGPYDTDIEATRLIQAMQDYREVRGLKP